MKRIAIIGGGISGLTVLHYLKQRLGDSAQITLYEREAATGGTIRSTKKDSYLIEWGPNGFLDNQPATLKLIEELGLTDQLIEAQPSSRQRYIQIKGQLQAIPANPFSFIRTPLLSFKDKCSLATGLFKRDIPTDTSIYNYVSQRFSVNVAENLVAPFISGIYAGDIRRLHMSSAFPKFKRQGFKKTRMRSFKGGMGTIIEALDQHYKSHIQTNAQIFQAQLDADITIVATPAYSAAKIVENINPVLARTLSKVPYAPVAVVGMLFTKDSFKQMPEGFGYLIPSKEYKDVLGVLVESNVYANRAGEGQVLLRVLLGGAHNPSIINDNQEKIVQKAMKEIDDVYGLVSNPIDIFVKLWPQAIPQYEINYPVLRRTIAEEAARTPGLYLCANYLDGISFNDCINNARTLALNMDIKPANFQ